MFTNRTEDDAQRALDTMRNEIGLEQEDERWKKHEKLTDEEQRTFLAAIAREREVCGKYSTVGQTNKLVQTCDEIVRKVRESLWT